MIPQEGACTRKLNAAATFVDDSPAELRAVKPSDTEAVEDSPEEGPNKQGSSDEVSEGTPESTIKISDDSPKIDTKLLIWLLCFIAAILVGTAIAVVCCCLPPDGFNDYPMAREDGAAETHAKSDMETEVDLIDAELNR